MIPHRAIGQLEPRLAKRWEPTLALTGIASLAAIFVADLIPALVMILNGLRGKYHSPLFCLQFDSTGPVWAIPNFSFFAYQLFGALITFLIVCGFVQVTPKLRWPALILCATIWELLVCASVGIESSL
jgi:hypothetical protein